MAGNGLHKPLMSPSCIIEKRAGFLLEVASDELPDVCLVHPLDQDDRQPLEDLKQRDNREPIADLKRLMDSDPKLGFAFRTAVEKVKSGELTTEELIAS